VPEPTGNLPATIGADRPARLRVFFALWPDPATRELVVALAREAAKRARGSAPRPENIHLTLAFVGEVAPERVDALERIGDAAARAAAPFTLMLDRRGGFRDSRIAWLGTGVMPPELDRLVRDVNEGLVAGGFRVERRPFRAHVTLARRCRTPPGPDTVAPIAWRVPRLMLTASELSPQGAHYRELAAWPLGAP
jgi:2'-5' RNA ligase